MIYDIAVLGLGPSGSSFLKRIEGKGFKVIAFDKDNFPRKKVCAGGLTPKAYRLLEKLFPGIDEVVRVQSKKFVFINNSSKVEVNYNEVLTYLTDRQELDNFLFDSISNSYFEIHTGEKVLSLCKENKIWKIETDKDIYKAKVIIVADGVNSKVARQFKVKRDIGFTYEADIEHSWNDNILIDFSDFSWGYYWIFPKGDFITTGLGELKRKAFDLKEKLFRFNRKFGIEGKIKHQSGFPIPVGKTKNDVYRNNVLFLGDAGGLVDPFTGEGIYYAVKSGVISAEIVMKAFEKGNLDILKLYKELIDESMGKEFFWARTVGNLFFRFKRLNFYVLEKEPSIQKLITSLLTGEISYKQGVKKFFKLLPKLVVRS
ncbi:geranylgeranyl reductase [Desulfurobacterium thermolithotrophum DSM 11699]|uniref:Geranylgeranyl reductase n=1 Tax=Desulfurobacterium thermolithotrophum (strain DSM 11699 / BSA) TaxID=868864 RepID=F0S1N0_DESTD|nr:NAD(P)/FAD-dependent oxidoreductase [Desulfurobacterium thermolithotrophum]ADY74033.1 geranylgeranyl reductase [Desulfurobacterium thermolithotrophum DSM 11699]